MAIPRLNDPYPNLYYWGTGIKINNFFGAPQYTCCSGGGGIQNWMFGLAAFNMINQSITNIFNMFKKNDGQGAAPQPAPMPIPMNMPMQFGMPMQMGMGMPMQMPMASTFYPYVNFQHAPYGNGNGSTDGMGGTDAMAQQGRIRTLMALPENRNYYKDVKFNPDGSGFLIKDDNSIPFADLDELENMLNERVGKKAEKADETETDDNKAKASKDEAEEGKTKVEDTKAEGTKAEDTHADEAAGASGEGKNDKKSKFTYPDLGGVGTWKNYNKSNIKNDNIKVGMTVEELVSTIGAPAPLNEEYVIELYEKANPNAIKDGKIVDLNKLDIIIPAKDNAKSDKPDETAKAKESNLKTMYGGTYFNDEVGKEIAGHTFKQGAQFAGTNGWYSEDSYGFWEDNGYLVINGHAYTLEGNNKGITVDFEDFKGFQKDKNGKMRFGGTWDTRYTLYKDNLKLKAEIYTKGGIAYLDLVTKDGKKHHYDLNEIMNATSYVKDFPL